MAKRGGAQRQTPEEKLVQTLYPYIKSGDYVAALALGAAALVFRDGSRYSAISKAVTADPRPFGTVLAALKDAQAKGVFEKRGGRRRLLGLVQRSPLALIAWLDHLLLTGSVGTSGVPVWAQPRTVLEVRPSEGERRTLALPPIRTWFVFPRVVQARPAPVESQHADPSRFLRHWVVVPAVPDLNQSAREVQVGSANGVFQSTCEHVVQRGRLRIYLAEFNPLPLFESQWGECHQLRRPWRAKGLRNLASIQHQALQHLERAREQRADVVVFPELTMPGPVLEAVSDWLNDHAVLEDPCAAPGWVVAGSFHCADDDGRCVNRATVLDRLGNRVMLSTEAGERPFAHDKMTAVELGGDMAVIEDTDKGTELLLAYTPLGLQAVVICLDLAQSGTTDMLPLERLPLRWLWVPSLSQRVDAHQARAKTFCLQRLTTTVCANQGDARFDEAGRSLGGAPGTGFVWTNDGRSSRAAPRVAPLPVDKPAPEGWQLFEVELSVTPPVESGTPQAT